MTKMKRKKMVVWLSVLRNGLKKNMYLKILGGLQCHDVTGSSRM